MNFNHLQVAEALEVATAMITTRDIKKKEI
jgi:hypothetical protein